MNINYAFLTSEYPTTSQNAGGLATYVHRMSKAMSQAGISVNVFVLNDSRDDTILDGCIRVHHVLRPKDSALIRFAERILQRFRLAFFYHYYRYMRDASIVANYISSLSPATQFDVIQYSDYLGIGRCLSRLHARKRVVRCSSAIELYMKADRRYDSSSLAHAKVEVESIKNADIIISPSELVASFYAEKLQRPVKVVRPPAYLEANPNQQAIDWLPRKYLLHYAGWLQDRKGTNILLSALEQAVQVEPDMMLILIGNMASATSKEYSRLFAQHPNNIIALPVVDKPTLYGVIQRAHAVVLPSLVDNMPNTLIEALLLNANVIVASGSSLDEVVKSYQKSSIIDPAKVSELAVEMVRAWERPVEHEDQGNFTPWINTTEGSAFKPKNALQSHLQALHLINS